MKIKDLEVVRYRLEEPLHLPAQPGCERYIHTLVGAALAESARDAFDLASRRSIFEPPKCGALFAGSEGLRITPQGSVDILVATAVVPDDGAESALVGAKEHKIGEGNHARTVYEILGGDGPSQRLRCGETVNAKGGWSSWPPHSFDHSPELADKFEEIFVCFTRPRNGYGLMRRKGVWNDGSEVDDVISVRSGDMQQVPLGSHPIVGAPDTELMYVWFYLSPVPKVYAKWAEDVGGYQ